MLTTEITPRMQYTVDKLRNTLFQPETWDDAAAAVTQELLALDLVNYEELPQETVEHLYMDGQWDRLAGAAMRALREHSVFRHDIHTLLVKKQRDYGHRNILMFGLDGIVVRLWDKIARFENLRGREAANESATDTLIDIVGYITIAIMVELGWFTLDVT